MLAPAGASALVIDHAVGLRLTGGGNLWTEPDNSTSGDGLGFGDTGGGWAIGVAGHYELRLLKFVALEVGVGWEQGNLMREVELNGGVAKITEKVEGSSLRIPILVKGVLPLGLTRLSLGLGPEFVVPLSVDASHDASSGARSSARIEGKKASSTLLTGDLGVVIALPLGLEIPLALRVSYNLSQEADHVDRVRLQGGVYEVTFRNSLDLRLMAGVGYGF